ncbi:MAG: acyl-CoA dehydrogenase family protein, partial [Pseudomonadota bacterium]
FKELMVEAGAANLIGIEVPTDFDGQGLDFSIRVAAAQRLARVDFATAMGFINTHNVALKLAQDAEGDWAAEWIGQLLSGTSFAGTAITEVQAGSDLSQMQASAARTDDGWRLNAHKAWIINGDNISAAILYAQTDASKGIDGIAGFFVALPEHAHDRTQRDRLNEYYADATGSISLTEHMVPAEAMVTAPGEVITKLLPELNRARIYVAAMCVGMVEDCLQTAATYGLTRETFGSNLHGHQGWRWQLARASTDLAAAQALVDQAVADILGGGDAQILAAQAKLFATTMAKTHIGQLMQAMGAEGLRPTQRFQRHHFAAQVAGTVDGTDEMLLERIAKQVKQDAERAGA